MPVDTARVGTSEYAPPLGWILPLVLGGAALLGAGRLFGGPLVVPALSLVLLVAGFLMAGSLFLMRRGLRQTTVEAARLLAGALVLMGFAAALLNDNDAALVALDGMHGGPRVAAGK